MPPDFRGASSSAELSESLLVVSELLGEEAFATLARTEVAPATETVSSPSTIAVSSVPSFPGAHVRPGVHGAPCLLRVLDATATLLGLARACSIACGAPRVNGGIGVSGAPRGVLDAHVPPGVRGAPRGVFAPALPGGIGAPDGTGVPEAPRGVLDAPVPAGVRGAPRGVFGAPAFPGVRGVKAGADVHATSERTLAGNDPACITSQRDCAASYSVS